jgi:hypothetical protein
LRYAPYKNKLVQAKWVERLRSLFSWEGLFCPFSCLSKRKTIILLD